MKGHLYTQKERNTLFHKDWNEAISFMKKPVSLKKMPVKLTYSW